MLYCFSNGKTIPYKGKNKDFVSYREAFFVEIFLIMKNNGALILLYEQW